MTEPNNKRKKYQAGKRRYVLFLATALVLLFAGIAASADLLTKTERAWLDDQGTIRFASQTVYPPFEFVNRRGNPQGMCIELVQWMSTELGFKPSFRHMTFKAAQEAVLSGQVDVLTSMFYSEERDLRFDFTEMTWEVPALIFVRAERPDITSLADLQGKRIAMQRGDYAAEFLKSKRIEYDLVPTATFAEATDKVIAGEADAVIGDRQIVLYHLFSNGLTDRVKSVGEPLYIGRNCMSVREGRRELIGILNKGLALARKRGVFERITRKWVGTQYVRKTSWMQRHAWHLAIALVVMAVLAALVGIRSIRLRQIIARRTRELQELRDALRPIGRDAAGVFGLKTWFLVLAVLIPLCVAGDYALRHHLILPSFLSLEQEEAERAISGCVDAIQREMHHLGQIAIDWAMWDDTYQFVQDSNTAYAESNFQWESLVKSGIHMITILDPDGRVVWGSAYDIVRDAEISLDVFPRDSFPKSHPLLRHATPDRVTTGIVLTQNGPLLVVSHPILTSAGKGPSRGTLIMGRFLLEETIQNLSKQTGVRFSVRNPRTSELNERELKTLAGLSPGTQVMEAVNDDVLMAYGMLTDIEGHPALLVSVTLPRKIMQRGRAMARLVSMTILAALAIIGACLFACFISSLTEALQRQKHIEALVRQRTSAFRESEEKYRITFQSTPDSITITRIEDGRYLYVNDGFCRMTGYTREEAVGKTPFDLGLFVDPADRDRMIEILKDKGYVEGLEIQYRVKAGNVLDTLLSARPLRYGNEDCLVAVVKDISAIKRSEAEKRKLEAQLQHAQRMESIGVIASGVAHNFRNVLTVILTNSQLIQMNYEDLEPLQKFTGRISKASERGAKLVKQLMRFSRKEASEKFEEIDLARILHETCELAMKSFDKKIEIVTDIPESLPIMGNYASLSQVFMNLFTNSRDAMPDGGKIRVVAEIVGDKVEVSISDTGCGMDSGIMEKCFDPFFTTKAVDHGTGLGLSTAYGIVKGHGGEIHVYSEPGRGTTFTIYFSINASGEPEHHASAAAITAGKGEKVMVVDDEKIITISMQEILESLGYTPRCVTSGEEAIAAYPVWRPQAVLLDRNMPRMDGITCAKRIFELDAAVKIVFISGYDEEGANGLDEDTRNLIAGYIKKPIDVAELGRVLAKAMGRRLDN